MLNLSIQKKPLLLKPNPPASEHQLSYTMLTTQKLRTQLDISKHQSYIQQNTKLTQIIKQNEQTMQQFKQIHLKQILLLNLQLQHQTQITSKYDNQLRKCQASRREIQQFYQMKLQIMKKQLIEGFQKELQAEKQRTYQQLGVIKENYCTKIAVIAQANKSREFDFVQKQQKYSNYQLRINLLQSQIAQKQRQIVNQTQKISALQQKSINQQAKLDSLNLKNQQNSLQSIKNIDNLRQRLRQSQSLKQQLHRRYKAINYDMQLMTTKMQNIEHQNITLRDQLENILRKYNYIQKQFDQLNRKTFKNKDKDEYDKNGRALESGRETQRDREREKQKEKQKQKESEKQRQRQKQREKQREKQRQRQKQREKQREKERQRQRQRQRDDKQFIANLQNELINLQSQLKLLQQQKQSSDKLILQLKQSKFQQSQKSQQIQQNNQKQTDLKYQNLLKQHQKLLQQLKSLKSQLQTKESQLQTLKSQLQSLSQNYTRKLQYFLTKNQQINNNYQQNINNIQQLNEKIDNIYLKQMLNQKRQIQSLDITLMKTNQMMAQEAKDKKNLLGELQELRKNQKKK